MTTRPHRHDTVTQMLNDYAHLSDRLIAEKCSVSPKLVGRVRASLGHASQDAKRVGRDGRLRPTQPGVDRDRIAEALRARPDSSLRTIAAALGVSPETVRSVKRSEATASNVESHRVAPPAKPRTILAPLPQLSSHRTTPRTWSHDQAFCSTDSGSSFVSWLEQTTVSGNTFEQALVVPLNRTYEIADEARRRAVWWRNLADTLETRVHRRAI